MKFCPLRQVASLRHPCFSHIRFAEEFCSKSHADEIGNPFGIEPTIHAVAVNSDCIESIDVATCFHEAVNVGDPGIPVHLDEFAPCQPIHEMNASFQLGSPLGVKGIFVNSVLFHFINDLIKSKVHEDVGERQISDHSRLEPSWRDV